MADSDPNSRDVTGMLNELHDLQRFQKWLEPLAMAALLIQAWAFVEALRSADSYGTAILTAAVSSFLLVWAHRHAARTRRLEEELLPWLD